MDGRGDLVGRGCEEGQEEGGGGVGSVLGLGYEFPKWKASLQILVRP